PLPGLSSRLGRELADRLRDIPGTELVRLYGDSEELIDVTLDRNRSAAHKASSDHAPLSAASVQAPAGGHSRQCGPRNRATRPPSWSIRTGARHPTVSRSSATKSPTWVGVSMFRANRMKPQGFDSAKKAHSSGVNRDPRHPKIAAVASGGVRRSDGERAVESDAAIVVTMQSPHKRQRWRESFYLFIGLE
nr:hypothetical protein [Paracoccaceae bacterium]